MLALLTVFVLSICQSVGFPVCVDNFASEDLDRSFIGASGAFAIDFGRGKIHNWGWFAAQLEEIVVLEKHDLVVAAPIQTRAGSEPWAPSPEPHSLFQAS